MILADPELPDCVMLHDVIPWIIGGFLAAVALVALVGLAGAWFDAMRERDEPSTTEKEIEEDSE